MHEAGHSHGRGCVRNFRGKPAGHNRPPEGREAWQALTDAYKSASSSISNTDVKKTVDDLAKDAQAVTDQIEAVYIENDLSKLAEYTNAIQDMSSHQETLTNLCNANK